MAVEGFALQAGTYGAEVTRRWVGALLRRGASIGSIESGLVGAGDLEITASTGLHIKIAPGEAFIAGSSSSSQGGYYFYNSASKEETLPAANASNPRIERICAVVKDAAYAGSENTFTTTVVTGTAESGATLTNLKGAGAQPASSFSIGFVLVPAKATSISSAEISNNTSARALIGLPSAGIALGQSYVEALTTRSAETEYEPSTTRATLVMLTVAGKSGRGIEIYCGGVRISNVTLGPEGSGKTASASAATFICPAGKKWKYALNELATVQSSYLSL